MAYVHASLSHGIPSSMAEIHANDGAQPIKEPTVAAFWSVNNIADAGLARLQIGARLIKSSIYEAQLAHPSLTTFVTLSPIPAVQEVD